MLTQTFQTTSTDKCSNVAPDLLKKIKKGGNPISKITNLNQRMFFSPITETEVIVEIAKLSKNKASDIYNLIYNGNNPTGK